MSSKNKLHKFAENDTFACLYQPKLEDVWNKNHKFKGVWGSCVFGNKNPIALELGCGKGEYAVGLSQKFPNKNFIGIDIKGARLWTGAKFATESNLQNIRFLRTRIDFIESFFGENEISEIWITFPDPQIKKHKKRLTGSMFLNRYRKFLKPEGIIYLKTDSQFLFAYTYELAKQNNLEIVDNCNDIYKNNEADDVLSIKTFYESFFISKGLPITYIAFKINTGKTLCEPVWNYEKLLANGRESREIVRSVIL